MGMSMARILRRLGRRLDGRRGFVAHVEQRLQYRGLQTQVREGAGIGRV